MDATTPPSERFLLDNAKKDGIDTGRERLEKMKPQCGFGELGTCCRICYMGPCRIDPFGDGPKTGICGLSPDSMVARNLLRECIGGAASHVGHARHVLLTMKEALDGEAPYEIRGVDRLMTLAGLFDIETEGREVNDIARDLVDIALEDFGRQDHGINNWMKARSNGKELEMWKEAGLTYANPHNQIETGMHATSMGNDADPVSLLKFVLRMGLVDGFSGLTLATDIQDVVFGTPQVHTVGANMGVLEENSVNLAVHGHNPMLSEKILEATGRMEEDAKSAGAEGINVVGICCTGNELSMRHGVPLAAHNLQSELILTTGAVDAMVVDIQCIWPQLPTLAKCYDTAFITTDEMVHLPGATHIEFEPKNANGCAEAIVRAAIDAFKARQGKEVNIPDNRTEAMVGLSVEAIVGILSKVDAENPLKPVIDNIVEGNIFGAVGIAGCSSIKFRDSNMTERMVKGLLKENILVVTTGCTAHICAQDSLLTPEATEKYCGDGLKAVLTAIGEAAGLGGPLPPVWHMGSCVDNVRIVDLLAALANALDVKISQLPAVASAPELVQEKAISIGSYLLAQGLTLHIAPAPRILGSQLVTQVLTQDLVGITGGRAFVECDPDRTVELMVESIAEKRKALGI